MMGQVSEKISKNFGFGFLRLPMTEGKLDTELINKMVDLFLEAGFNYFDTAHNYLNGASEEAFKLCVADRHPRDAFVLTDKLTTQFFTKREEIRPLFKMQLEKCGVDHFDYYFMHSQNKDNFAKFKACGAYEEVLAIKEEGGFEHFGMSFHDSPELLDQILTEYPQIEVVQLQFNYADYESPMIQSKACYDVCMKHGKPVFVMEPVKGGHLVNLPDEANKVFDELPRTMSNAGYAIRFAASHPGVKMVLSGMSNMEQVQDNISIMKDFVPFSDEEYEAVRKVAGIFNKEDIIQCTACRYCVPGCPKNILIPDVFTCLNSQKRYGDWQSGYFYKFVYTKDNGRAMDCIRCGKCEKTCPQHLPIRDLLLEAVEVLDKKEFY